MSDPDNSVTVNTMLPPHRNLSDSSAVMESHLRSVSHTGVFRQSWSVYRQLTAALRPKTLSCMTSGSQAVELTPSVSKNRLERLKALQSVDDEVQQFVDSETFMERLARTFAYDPHNGYTDQRKNVEFYTKAVMSTFAVFGVLHGVAEGRQKFKDVNKVTMFGSKMMVYKRRTNHMVKHGIECGVKLWFKCSLVWISFIGIQQFVEIYFNKSSIWSFSLAYGITGALGRIPVGPKAMGATFIIGCVIGSIVGALVLTTRRYSHLTQEDQNFNAAKAYCSARRQFNMPLKPYVSSADDVEEAD